jgi:pyruvate kinase
VGAAVQVVENIRRVSERLSIMIDTKGPEIRTTPVAAPIRLSTGAIIHIAANAEQLSTPECINVGYPRFVRDVNVGRTVLIDDGEVALEVVGRDAEGLECRVLNDAVLGGRKTVNVPSVRFDLPALTDKDRAFIQFAIEHEVDFIAHSFVRQKEDILAVQRLLDERHSPIQIIAKIENQEGVDNVDEILDHAHGIMVARGDLGIEVPYERLPGIQKAIIDKCIERRNAPHDDSQPATYPCGSQRRC